MENPVFAWLIQFLLAILRYGLAVLFLFSSINKICDRHSFRNTVRSYRLLPTIAIGPFSFFLPWFELLLSVLLIVGWQIKPVGWMTGFLYGLFILALSVNLLRGQKDLDCGCFGSKKKHNITIGLILRDVGLMLASFVIAIYGGGVYAFDNLTSIIQFTFTNALREYLLPIALILIGLVLLFKMFNQTLRLMYLANKE